MTKYIVRDISKTIAEALKEMPAVILTGMRQTGKSTMLQKDTAFRNRKYISLDDFAYLEAAKENPDSILNTDEYVTIDEVQKCPELLTAIKRKIDKKRVPGQFLLSGSANFALLKNISETLAGRAIYFTLHPFTLRELSQKIKKKPFIVEFFERERTTGNRIIRTIKNEEVIRGGMPSVCLGEIRKPSLWFKGYEQTYLERDVREFSQIGNLLSFRNLLHFVALRSGQILSPSELGRDAKLNVATTSRYLSILEASFIIYRLLPYLKSKTSRLIKSPKIYVSDSGLACYLAGIENLSSHPMRGAMFETFMLQNLAGILNSTWPEVRLYFWNIQGRHEVDFVIEAKNRCIAIEVKSGAIWGKKDLRGLEAFLSKTKECIAGILAYNGTEVIKIDKKLWVIPLGLILS